MIPGTHMVPFQWQTALFELWKKLEDARQLVSSTRSTAMMDESVATWAARVDPVSMQIGMLRDEVWREIGRTPATSDERKRAATIAGEDNRSYELLAKVREVFTRDDELPDGLLGQIDALLERRS